MLLCSLPVSAWPPRENGPGIIKVRLYDRQSIIPQTASHQSPRRPHRKFPGPDYVYNTYLLQPSKPGACEPVKPTAGISNTLKVSTRGSQAPPGFKHRLNSLAHTSTVRERAAVSLAKCALQEAISSKENGERDVCE